MHRYVQSQEFQSLSPKFFPVVVIRSLVFCVSCCYQWFHQTWDSIAVSQTQLASHPAKPSNADTPRTAFRLSGVSPNTKAGRTKRMRLPKNMHHAQSICGLCFLLVASTMTCCTLLFIQLIPFGSILALNKNPPAVVRGC